MTRSGRPAPRDPLGGRRASDTGGGRSVRLVTTRRAVLACLLALALGVLALVGLALPALGDGRTLVGVVVGVCAALGVVAGLAGLVVAGRAHRRP